MAGVMIHGGEGLRRLGVEVDYLFGPDLGRGPRVPQGRRVIAPWMVVKKVARLQRQGKKYDVVEIHEPLASAYCALRGFLGLPPCVVLSHGLEMGHWAAQRARWRALGLVGSRKSRIPVPLTLLSQANYAIRHADQVIVPTLEDVEYLEKTMRVQAARISRVDNGAPPMP